MEKRDCRLIRYGDDFAILCKDKSLAEETIEFIKMLLSSIHLSLNSDKTRIFKFGESFRFLGRVFTNNSLASHRSELSSEVSPKSRNPELPVSSCTRLMRTLYIQEQRAVLRRDHERIVVTKGKEVLLKVPAIKIDQIIIFGNCAITTPILKYCLLKRIPITLLSNNGSYYGRIDAPFSNNIELQRQQLLKSLDPTVSLAISKAIIKAKITNSKVLLQRHNRKLHSEEIERTIALLGGLLNKIEDVKTLCELRGIEGTASANYFKGFRLLLKNGLGFTNRIKHPPTDPVNSLLSFGYTLLFYNIYSFLNIYGLSPYLGFFHTNKGRHPVLTSDMIEEFRSPVVDSLVVYLVNSSILKDEDFYSQKDKGMCLLTDEARKTFIKHFEDRMQTRITHPTSGLLATWRQCLELQVKELVNYLQDRIDHYRPMMVRY